MGAQAIVGKLKTAFKQDGVFRLASGLAIGLVLAWHYAPSSGAPNGASPPPPQAAAQGATNAVAPSGPAVGGAGAPNGPQTAPVSTIGTSRPTTAPGGAATPPVAAPVPSFSFPTAPSAPAHQRSSGAVIDGDAPIAR